MERVVEPEWLDELAASDRRAIRSREDLRRINRLMGNASLLANLLRPGMVEDQSFHLVELGSGDGAFALNLTRRLSATVRVSEITLVDRVVPANALSHEAFRKRGCTLNVVQADVFDWLACAGPASILIANLFLHHFQADELRKLMELAAERSRVFAACEPRRSQWGLAGSRLLGLIGCNDVTRHDAVVSIRAGFAGQELSALWPRDNQWRFKERAAGLFSHVFMAQRSTPSRTRDAVL